MPEVGLPRLNSPERWYARAVEARRMAERMHDPDTRRAMEAVAAGYERLAAWAESYGAQQRRNCGRAPPAGDRRA